MGRVRLLTGIRTVAIALIIFPEPVTTAIGIAVLGASFAFTRPKSLKRFRDLDGLTKRSIQNSQPQGFRRCFTEEQTHRIKLDMVEQLPVTQENPGALSARLTGNWWFDNRKVSNDVIYHALKTSLPQYEANPLFRAAGLTKTEPGIEYHKLKLNPVH
jgi:hypothetical protein